VKIEAMKKMIEEYESKVEDTESEYNNIMRS
jgi:hypothetical protein